MESEIDAGKMKGFKGVAFVFFLTVMISCAVKPEPIAFGEDHCTYCKMGIVDPKYGGELVTTKGKIYKFDALECLVPYLEQSDQSFAFTLGIAYDQPKKLVAVDSLHFVISGDYNSPMGANLAAFSEPRPSEEVLDWTGLKSRLSQ